MPYGIGPGKPLVTLDTLALEKLMAAEFDARGITTNTARDLAIAGGLSQATINAFVTRLIGCFNLGPLVT